jgi:hypothetical protein
VSLLADDHRELEGTPVGRSVVVDLSLEPIAGGLTGDDGDRRHGPADPPGKLGADLLGEGEGAVAEPLDCGDRRVREGGDDTDGVDQSGLAQPDVSPMESDRLVALWVVLSPTNPS